MATNRGWATRAVAAAKIALPSAQDAATGAAPPLDFGHLRRYTLNNAELEREVLDLFIAQLPVTIAALRDAASDAAWKMAAHTLKGSARAVGAWPLAAAAEQAEKLVGETDPARARQVAEIEHVADAVRDFVSAAHAAN